MLSIEHCRKFLRENMPDSEVERVRDALYVVAHVVVDDYLKSSATVEPCKKH